MARRPDRHRRGKALAVIGWILSFIALVLGGIMLFNTLTD